MKHADNHAAVKRKRSGKVKQSPIIGLCKDRRTHTSGALRPLENYSATGVLGLRHGDEKLVPLPEALKWAPPPRDEQRVRALPVLRTARALFKSGLRLVEAISEAGDGRIECEYARRAIRDVLGEVDLMGWSERGSRTRREVFLAIDRAVAMCSKAKHAGGWNVTPIRRGAA